MAQIAAALSGGVDSSVAAARLLAQGHEVVGLTARLVPMGGQPSGRAPSEQAAASVCRVLGIEHHVVDLTEEFAARVLDYFTQGYAQGLTPNPCLPCNAFVKFGALLDQALGLGCEALATGHYVRRRRRGGRWGLQRGVDESKDQSYVLMFLTQDQLARARFPLGTSRKSEVIEEARRLGLPVLMRDSQDLCFVPEGVDYADWLAERVASEPGPILDLDGRELGRHRGLIHYTVGQRRGLGMGGGPPLFVLAKDPLRNALIVGPREALCRRRFDVESVNWVSLPPPAPGTILHCSVTVRYNGPPIEAEVEVVDAERCRVQAAPHGQAVAPGQGAAFYDEEGWLLGGGFLSPPENCIQPGRPAPRDQQQ